MSIRKIALTLALVVPALSAFALDAADIAKSVPLKDGSTLHQFKDGKMAVENKYGNAVSVKAGSTVVAADGQSIQVTSNEIARLFNSIQSHNVGAN